MCPILEAVSLWKTMRLFDSSIVLYHMEHLCATYVVVIIFITVYMLWLYSSCMLVFSYFSRVLPYTLQGSQSLKDMLNKSSKFWKYLQKTVLLKITRCGSMGAVTRGVWSGYWGKMIESETAVWIGSVLQYPILPVFGKALLFTIDVDLKYSYVSQLMFTTHSIYNSFLIQI